ncbi:sensor histidine kinase [Treponema sp.]|uniref:cache domain-containing sensor histidine kinase n=1 Tax=Treponema sp. TaxID=166 RepID=UPI002600B9A1|nr:histidine kinase [Treponema sp.]MCR5218179.1 histidine kinase [Treponema sp.]
MKLLNNLFSKINRFKISQKLYVIYAVTFFIPLLLAFTVFISWLSKTLTGWESKEAESSVKNIHSFLNETFTSITDLSDVLYLDKTIKEINGHQYRTPLEVYQAYQKIKFLDDLLKAYYSISSVRYYTSNMTLHDNSFFTKNTYIVTRSDWYRKAVELKGAPFWCYKNDSITGKNHLAMIRSVWNGSDESLEGVMCININSDYINQKLKNIAFTSLIELKSQSLFSSLKDPDMTLINLVGSKDRDTIKLNGKTFSILRKEFSPLRGQNEIFTINLLVSLENLSKTTSKFKMNISIMFIAFILSSLLMIIILAFSIHKRVYQVRNGIQSVGMNNFDISPSIGGKDEFSEIYDSVYETSLKIKKLINEVYMRDIEKEQLTARQNDIRFKMLSAQINPHFLFNTLEHIRMKALSCEDKDVPYMLKILTKILRYNLSVKDENVLLSQEIEIVGNYLDIQHKRFGERISFDIVPLCEIKNIKIIPLLIQPLVENCFAHGLESKTENGFIYILIRTVEENGETLLKITVQDNGEGISNEKLDELNKRLNNNNVEDFRSSLGLVNVNQRIKLFYGQKYGITIDSTPGIITAITLTLPLITGE